MALTELKSDLSKFRRDFTTPPIELQANKDRSVDNHKKTNQLGEGSKFNYTVNSAPTDKIFSELGYHYKKRYSDIVKSIKGDPNKSLLFKKSTEQNSPSAIDEQYKKYNLQDESFNPSFIMHPLVLRGIQRRGKVDVQRWGVDALQNIDGGLIRGGMSTAIERTAADVIRINKFLLSPKGVLWQSKQMGLAKSNPKVEIVSGVRGTRLRGFILPSIEGSAFGLHITSHGIPFQNDIWNYETVSTTNNSKELYKQKNRLIKLRRELGLFESKDGKLSIGHPGQSIKEVSGPGGPNSLYGAGDTIIRRASHTRNFGDAESNYLLSTKRTSKNMFAGGLRAQTKHNNDTNEDQDKINRNTFDTTQRGEKIPTLRQRVEDSTWQHLKIETSTARDRNGYKNENGNIHNYATIAYNSIPKKRDTTKIRDFRVDINKNAQSSDNTKSYLGYRSDTYYDDNNRDKKYGLGTPGAVGADRSDPNKFLVESKDFGKGNHTILSKNTNFRGDKINALDIVSQGQSTDLDAAYGDNRDFVKLVFEDGDQGQNIMIFRATLTGFQDTFSPNWNPVEILGRPDSAYLYGSFSRSIGFSFTVAATSRSEMIPMWRKINYLASYTTPDYIGNRPFGAFMRITIGSLFCRTPALLESFSLSVPDDATWDIAEDADNPDAKQLPMMVELTVGLKIVSDFRPQKMGRMYSLSPRGVANKSTAGQWLSDSSLATS